MQLNKSTMEATSGKLAVALVIVCLAIGVGANNSGARKEGLLGMNNPYSAATTTGGGMGQAMSGKGMSQAQAAAGNNLSEAMTGRGMSIARAASSGGLSQAVAGPGMSQASAGGRSGSAVAGAYGGPRFVPAPSSQSYMKRATSNGPNEMDEARREAKQEVKRVKKTLKYLESRPSRSLTECDEWERLNALYNKLIDDQSARRNYRDGEYEKGLECAELRRTLKDARSRLVDFRRLIEAEGGQIAYVGSLLAEYLELSRLMPDEPQLAAGFGEMVNNEPAVREGVRALDSFISYIQTDVAPRVANVYANAPSNELDALDQAIRRLVDQETHLSEPEFQHLTELTEQLEQALASGQVGASVTSGQFRYLSGTLDAARAVLLHKFNEHESRLVEEVARSEHYFQPRPHRPVARLYDNEEPYVEPYVDERARRNDNFVPLGANAFATSYGGGLGYGASMAPQPSGPSAAELARRERVAELAKRERAAEEYRNSFKRESTNPVKEAIARAEQELAEREAERAAKQLEQSKQQKQQQQQQQQQQPPQASAVAFASAGSAEAGSKQAPAQQQQPTGLASSELINRLRQSGRFPSNN